MEAAHQRVNSRENDEKRTKKKGNYELLLHNSRADIYTQPYEHTREHVCSIRRRRGWTRASKFSRRSYKRSERRAINRGLRCASFGVCLQHHPEITESPSCVRVNRNNLDSAPRTFSSFRAAPYRTHPRLAR
ncbi:unnamed protein product [Trichogramma brassicae]|uniref:Uncharacterized protein n=1 Tax=Trichogramma brassicae TaxID=86971 RepID=A0A6H5HZM2_9HYME|nr:unnamed protein product [Trichogramma brassicae]